MPEQYRAIVDTRPGWATVAFSIAVFGGALGGLLLLLRKSVAYYLFIASLVGAVIALLPFHFRGIVRPGAYQAFSSQQVSGVTNLFRNGLLLFFSLIFYAVVCLLTTEVNNG